MAEETGELKQSLRYVLRNSCLKNSQKNMQCSSSSIDLRNYRLLVKLECTTGVFTHFSEIFGTSFEKNIEKLVLKRK